jgi:nucleoside 2-deoxyribosyltransferase
MRIYVAGSFKEKKNINDKWIKLLEEKGYEITHNWTNYEGENRRERCKHTQQFFALKDMQGVKRADCVVVIMDRQEYTYRGTNFEMGVATGAGIPILLFDPLWKDEFTKVEDFSTHATNVFYFTPGITHVNTEEQLLQRLEEMRMVTDHYVHNYNQCSCPFRNNSLV